MTSQPILFYSTNRQAPRATLRQALLLGQAPDRGLYMPDVYPKLLPEEIAAQKGRTYPEIAHFVLRRFTQGVIPDDRLAAICEDAYDYDVPLEQVEGRRYLMRLDRGPTASFKDFAARMMARWIGVFMEEDRSELVILTATSGDTGSAVAHAFHGVDRVRVVVLFPIAEVSNRQRKQMTTLGGNVTTIGVDGKFDDCQAIVKRAFADPDLAGIPLSSANSINIGRLLPQAVYYLYAYSRLARATEMEPVVFSVPSGNFGDMMGAVIAARLGVPMSRLVIATNSNDEVPKFVASGVYEKIVPSRVCISNAMNVGHPSNLARLVDAYGGRMDETGKLLEPPDMARLRRDVYAVSISEDETRATIRDAWSRHRALLEPHGAVGGRG
jgi:threonine synthase